MTLVLLKHEAIRASDGEVAIDIILDACVKIQSLVITRALMGGRMHGRPELLPVIRPPEIFTCLVCIDGGVLAVLYGTCSSTTSQ